MQAFFEFGIFLSFFCCIFETIKFWHISSDLGVVKRTRHGEQIGNSVERLKTEDNVRVFTAAAPRVFAFKKRQQCTMNL